MNIEKRQTSRRRPAGPTRVVPQQSFLARNRRRLLLGLAAVALIGLAGLAFLNATSPAYACTTEWQPAVTPEPAPGATQRLGYVQTDMGRDHVAIGSFVRYALCPPATGNHYKTTGEGPIKAGLYGPDDQTIPQGWIHNLEHGALVLLYRCAAGDSACTDAGQAALNQFNASFPNSPICNIPKGVLSPVIARFDQMKWPYAALVWGVVLPLDTLDTNQILALFDQQAERTNPEALCAKPTDTPGPTVSPAPSATPTAAPSVTPAPSAASASPTPAAS